MASYGLAFLSLGAPVLRGVGHGFCDHRGEVGALRLRSCLRLLGGGGWTAGSLGRGQRQLSKSRRRESQRIRKTGGASTVHPAESVLCGRKQNWPKGTQECTARSLRMFLPRGLGE